MKIAATASYSAVPSMLTVAPKGITSSADSRATPARSTADSSVTGKVAEELAVENAVKRAGDI